MSLPVYSQKEEQTVILDALRITEDVPGAGRFLDIGAFDGKTFSNTRALAQLGWSGVLVEPAPDSFAALAALYADRPDIALVNALVDPTDGIGLTRFLYSPGDALSTTIDQQAGIWADQVKFRETWLVPLRPGRLLQAFPGPYDVISIDTERTSVAILLALLDAVGGLLGNLGCKVLCVEHDERRRDVIEMCGNAYEVAMDSGENLILTRKPGAAW